MAKIKQSRCIQGMRITAKEMVLGFNILNPYELEFCLYQQEKAGITPQDPNCEIIIVPGEIKICHGKDITGELGGNDGFPIYLKVKHLTIFYLNLN